MENGSLGLESGTPIPDGGEGSEKRLRREDLNDKQTVELHRYLDTPLYRPRKRREKWNEIDDEDVKQIAKRGRRKQYGRVAAAGAVILSGLYAGVSILGDDEERIDPINDTTNDTIDKKPGLDSLDINDTDLREDFDNDTLAKIQEFNAGTEENFTDPLVVEVYGEEIPSVENSTRAITFAENGTLLPEAVEGDSYNETNVTRMLQKEYPDLDRDLIQDLVQIEEFDKENASAIHENYYVYLSEDNQDEYTDRIVEIHPRFKLGDQLIDHYERFDAVPNLDRSQVMNAIVDEELERFEMERLVDENNFNKLPFDVTNPNYEGEAIIYDKADNLTNAQEDRFPDLHNMLEPEGPATDHLYWLEDNPDRTEAEFTTLLDQEFEENDITAEQARQFAELISNDAITLDHQDTILQQINQNNEFGKFSNLAQIENLSKQHSFAQCSVETYEDRSKEEVPINSFELVPKVVDENGQLHDIRPDPYDESETEDFTTEDFCGESMEDWDRDETDNRYDDSTSRVEIDGEYFDIHNSILAQPESTGDGSSSGGGGSGGGSIGGGESGGGGVS